MLPGLIHSMLFGGAAGGASGPVILYDDDIYSYAIAPADAIGSVTFNPSGIAELDYGSASALYPYNWLITGVAADYEMSVDGGAFASLASGRNVYMVRSMVGVTNETVSIQIRTAATHMIVATGTITFTLEVNT